MLNPLNFILKFFTSINQKELNKLWIHGLIHLFGYKHKRNQDFNTMNKIEKKYLNLIN